MWTKASSLLDRQRWVPISWNNGKVSERGRPILHPTYFEELMPRLNIAEVVKQWAILNLQRKEGEKVGR